jgi:hypothetical protein
LEDNVAIDFDSKPDKAIQHRLVCSSVRISHQGWVEYFSQKSSATATWQKIAVLRDCYPLYLTENIFRCPQVKGALVWQPELGLVIDESWKGAELG